MSAENEAGLCFEQPAVVQGEDPHTFRNLVKQVSGTEISSAQAINFLEIFGDELFATLIEAKRKFIAKHFGTKAQSNSQH
jgi:hypothetical protein